MLLISLSIVSGIDINETCGKMTLSNYTLCDKGENLINCQSDCKLNLDTVLCLQPAYCSWKEEWFLQDFFIVLIVIVFFGLYKKYK